MALTRREFNKKLLFGLLAAAAAPKLIPEIIERASTPLPVWKIDTISKTISYVGKSDEPAFTVLEFHRYLSRLMDQPEMMDLEVPTERITDNMVNLVNGWRIDATAAEHITDGSIVDMENNNIWTSVTNIPNDKHFRIHNQSITIIKEQNEIL
jgi:hypothetical protein